MHPANHPELNLTIPDEMFFGKDRLRDVEEEIVRRQSA